MDRKTLLACLSLVALMAGPAVAADLGAPRAVAPYYKGPAPFLDIWSGFYIGIEGGGGFGRARQSDPLPFDSGSFDVSGGLVGGTIGYNYLFYNNLVFGVEGDGSWASIRGSTPGTNPIFGTCGGGPPACHADLQALGTLRARFGVAFDRVMPYVTGGFAAGSLHGNEGDVFANGAVGSGTTTVTGWTIGGGIEMKFTPNWSGKVEYLHVDLGNSVIFTDFIAPGVILANESTRFTAEIVRVGVNYRF
jgi:outer membrane immunogenic protein